MNWLRKIIDFLCIKRTPPAMDWTVDELAPQWPNSTSANARKALDIVEEIKASRTLPVAKTKLVEVRYMDGRRAIQEVPVMPFDPDFGWKPKEE